MNVGELVLFFETLIDEDDQTFVSDANKGFYLSMGYNEFRGKVTEYDPSIFMQSTVYTINDREFDLSTSSPQLLGSAANPRLHKLIRIARVSDTAGKEVIEYLDSGSSPGGAPLFGYALVNSKIIFGGNRDGYFRVDYVPEHQLQFDKSAVAPAPAYSATAFVDDLTTFHPLIALYAYRYYASRDGAFPPEIMDQLNRKEKEIERYLSTGRNEAGSQFVQPYRWYWY